MFVSSFLIVSVVLFVAWVVGFAFHLLGGDLPGFFGPRINGERRTLGVLLDSSP